MIDSYSADVEHTPAVQHDPIPTLTASERLRAFEDDVFGIKAVRINGAVERGYGSPYQQMTAEQRDRYQALERVVATEQNLANAQAAFLQAQADHKTAEAAVDG